MPEDKKPTEYDIDETIDALESQYAKAGNAEIKIAKPKRGKNGNEATCDIDQAMSCRELWSAALLRAISDGVGLCENRHDRRVAMAWIMANGRDFKEVCELSGHNPDTVRNRFIELCEIAHEHGPRTIQELINLDGCKNAI